MAEQTTFSEGLSRLDGAPLDAPYDLTDARLQDVRGVEAVLSPREPPSDTPPTPDPRLTPFRQGGTWIEGTGSTHRGQVRYVTTPEGQTPALTTYRGGSPNADTRIPQITEVDVGYGGQYGVKNPFTGEENPFEEDPWPRYIYYLLVPINSDGEAGPLAFAGARIPDAAEVASAATQEDLSLPRLVMTGNEYLRWVGVYRTPAIYEGGAEVTPGAQAFYEASRIGAGGGGVPQGAISEWATTIPPEDSFLVQLSNYYPLGSIDYIYLSSAPSINNGGHITGSDVDPIGWHVRFHNLPDPSSTVLSEGVSYEIYSTSTNANGAFRFHIRETDGTSLSFDAEDVLHTEWAEEAQREVISRGAQVEYIPPPGTGTTTATAIYSDDKNWYIDVGENQQEDFAPTGTAFDRPFNAFAAPSVGAQGDGGTPTITQGSGVLRPRASDLHYQGGLLFASAPQWPAKRPHPMYLETDASGGFDIRLQHEYSLPAGEVLGPPLELSDVTTLAVGWQGAEQAVNVYTKGGTPKYDIVGSNIAFSNTIELHDPISYWRTEVSAGQVITLYEADGEEVEAAIESVTVTDLTIDGNNDDVQITLDEAVDITANAQAVARKGTALTKSTGETPEKELEVRDPSGVFTGFVGGTITVYDIVARTGERVPNDYVIASASHSGTTTTITTEGSATGHASGVPVTISFVSDIDAVSTTDTTRLVVADPEDDLGGLASGTTITVEGGPNEGSHTLSSGAQSNTPSEGQTALPVNSLSEDNAAEGKVVHGSGGVNWELFRRVPVGPYGFFMREGSTFAFSAEAYGSGTTQGRADNVAAYAERIREGDAVFFSNTNRPLEITFDQFEVPEGETVRALFRARLAEEEGLRAYRFYVGTEQSIYVANPDSSERSVAVQPVTTAFGIGRNEQDQPTHAFVPGGVIIKATNEHLYALSGRRTERVFPDGQVPWSLVQGLAYDRSNEVLRVATDTGVWGFDRERKALVSQHDIDAAQLVWDEKRGMVLALDRDTSPQIWKGLHVDGWRILDINTGTNVVTVRGDRTTDFSPGHLIEVGTDGPFEVASVSLSDGDTELSLVGSISTSGATYVRRYVSTAAVQTQPLTHGGRELSLGEVKVDYDTLDYDAGDTDTLATLRQTRRYDTREVDDSVWRNQPWYPPLRGEGLQLAVSGFTRLEEIRIMSIEPAP